MISGKTVLALITARGGSKGIPKKNIKPLQGKPLLAWTIDAALKSKYIDRIIVSTDSREIANVAQSFGGEVPFLRPQQLALDETSSMDVILHALEVLPEKYDYLILLQPTSPFRSTKQIDGAIEQAVLNSDPVVVSVSRSHAHPNFMYEINENRLVPAQREYQDQLRRQDLPEMYEHNGSLYIADIEYIKEHRSFNTPDAKPYIINGFSAIDIDTTDDWELAELVAKGLRNSEQ